MWEIIRSNKRKTYFFLFLMALLLISTGFFGFEAIAPGGGGYLGLLVAGVVWFFLTMIAYFQGDNILLALSGAKELKRSDHPVLFNVVEEMTIASGLSKMPRVYLLDEEAPNAFAVGKSSECASVAVTSGLLKRLDRDELQGVIAHEIGHIRNHDVLLMVMMGVMLGTIAILADMASRSMFYSGGRSRTSSRRGGGEVQIIIIVIGVLLIILAPIIAQLIYFAISRKREYLADASSAQYTRYPLGLASALEKISRSTYELSAASSVTAPMYIINPMKLTSKGLADLTSTHPPTSERIRILKSMSGADFKAYDDAFKKVSGRPVGVIPFSALNEVQKQIPVKSSVPVKSSAIESASGVLRARETIDLLWKLNGLSTVLCDCGTKLKIPKEIKLQNIECPHCGKKHSIKEK